MAGQLSRRTQDTPSLLSASADVLQLAGVASDSAARLINLLQHAGVPLGSAGPLLRSTDQASFVMRIDRPLMDFKSFQPTRRTYGVTTFGSWSQTDGMNVLPTATSGTGGRGSSGTAGVQGTYSAYVGKRDWLLDVRSGLSATDAHSTPDLALPGAQVLVGTGTSFDPSPAGSTGSTAAALEPLVFGGNGALAARRRTNLWETQAELRFYPPRRTRHRVTLTADVRRDGVLEEPGVDRYGTFTYASLDDLAAGQAAAFTRTLSAPERRAGVWNGFVALGDYWRVTDRFQLMYGARAEGDVYATAAASNSTLERSLGVRTNFVPNTLGLSPRFGFTWVRSGQRDSYRFSNLGAFRVASTSVLRGGIGEFRNLLGPDLVAPAVAATGLPGSTTQLFCAGPAVPAVAWGDWARGASLPSACSPILGSPSSALTDTAPAVHAINRGFTAPRSWRGNLAWSASNWGIAYTMEGIVSLNLHQLGFTDANFAGIPRFATAGEGRPVYVTPSDVVPGSGVVAPAGSRSARDFGSVLVQGSDLRSVSRQVTLTLAPSNPNFSRWFASGAYTLGRITQQQRGFDGSTFGDPRTTEWGRGDLDVRHQIILQGGYAAHDVTFTVFGRVQSGRPFTPLVGSDVNGDGLINDRAFVFDPTTIATSDTALARDIQGLLSRGPRGVRDCLTRNLGRPAARNACDGPWGATLNARLAVGGERLHLGKRPTIGLSFDNVLGGVDQVLHGDRLRGWGAPALPNPVLYEVRGFDPTTDQYRYSVNPRFGDTRPAATTLRVPFRITLDVQLDIGRPLAEQQLTKFLAPGRNGRPGPRLVPADLVRRYARNVVDPYQLLIEQSDSLLLTREQTAALEAADVRYRTRVDSAWSALAQYLAELPDRYDAASALKRQEAIVDAVWELTRIDVQAVLPTVLSPVQQHIVPWPINILLTEKRKVNVRMFIPG